MAPATLLWEPQELDGGAEVPKHSDRDGNGGNSVAELVNGFRGITLSSDGQVGSATGGVRFGRVAGAHARVDTSDTEAIASRRTMMRAATPLAVLRQKKMESNTRQCFLVIEGRGWAVSKPVPMDEQAAARAFAARVNAAAATSAEVQVAVPSIDEISEMIENLATMKNQGLINEDQFSSQKAALIARCSAESGTLP